MKKPAKKPEAEKKVQAPFVCPEITKRCLAISLTALGIGVKQHGTKLPLLRKTKRLQRK